MYNISEVTDYIIFQIKSEDEHASLINLKLQKLLYYVQAWYYGINKKPFFDGDFQAWIHGPVNIEVYERFKSSKSLYSEIYKEDIISGFEKHLNSPDFVHVDFILENYAQFSGVELEQMTHSEAPWIIARTGYNPNERCEKIIQPQDMIDYYGKKWFEINNN